MVCVTGLSFSLFFLLVPRESPLERSGAFVSRAIALPAESSLAASDLHLVLKIIISDDDYQQCRLFHNIRLS